MDALQGEGVPPGPYEACFEGLIGSGCIAGLALLDARGSALYEKRVDMRLRPLGGGDGDRLVSPAEGKQLVAAVKSLTADGICGVDRLTCTGVPFRVFGGTPLGVYAVGPGRRVGMIARALHRVGFLVVFYRRPHLPQEVVPCVENFIDNFWLDVEGFR